MSLRLQITDYRLEIRRRVLFVTACGISIHWPIYAALIHIYLWLAAELWHDVACDAVNEPDLQSEAEANRKWQTVA